MTNIPNWWQTLLLLSAAYRVWRLLAYDTILETPRTWVLDRIDPTRNEKWSLFLLCPWCAGFWITGVALALYCIWYGWIGVLNFLVVWFAMSLGVGLLGSKVDTE